MVTSSIGPSLILLQSPTVPQHTERALIENTHALCCPFSTVGLFSRNPFQNQHLEGKDSVLLAFASPCLPGTQLLASAVLVAWSWTQTQRCSHTAHTSRSLTICKNSVLTNWRQPGARRLAVPPGPLDSLQLCCPSRLTAGRFLDVSASLS